jgi:cytochrome oxidase Cu insertion factor (SCO1/SenC/PrrC family)
MLASKTSFMCCADTFERTARQGGRRARRVSHSSAVFAFDREGQIRLLIRETDSLEAITDDLRQLLNANR